MSRTLSRHADTRRRARRQPQRLSGLTLVEVVLTFSGVGLVLLLVHWLGVRVLVAGACWCVAAMALLVAWGQVWRRAPRAATTGTLIALPAFVATALMTCWCLQAGEQARRIRCRDSLRHLSQALSQRSGPGVAEAIRRAKKRVRARSQGSAPATVQLR